MKGSRNLRSILLLIIVGAFAVQALLVQLMAMLPYLIAATVLITVLGVLFRRTW